MKKGDLVLAHMPYTDLTGTKVRPGLVLVSEDADNDVLLAFITSHIEREDETCVSISPEETPTCGLTRESIIRLNKLIILDKSIVIGKIGTLPIIKLQDINDGLRKVLAL